MHNMHFMDANFQGVDYSNVFTMQQEVDGYAPALQL